MDIFVTIENLFTKSERFADRNTARTVGSRRGKPVIFQVDAGAMDRDGFVFYRSDNNVWLTLRVPVEYLKMLA